MTLTKKIADGSFETAASRSPDLKNRRVSIVEALKRCMLSNGYAETSLTDLAKSANMSVSHLLYYYPSKEDVLNDLSDQVNQRILADVTAYRDEPAEERIHVLVDNVFVRGAMTRSELGLVSELIGLSTHRPVLAGKLRAFNTKMIAYLEDLFSKTPRQPDLSAIEAAEIAGALWMGLVNNINFDDQLSDSSARRLFRRSLLSLANFDRPAEPAPSKPTRKLRSKKPA